MAACRTRDAVDTNPPLIVLLTVPPAWAARVLGANAIPMFLTYVFVLAVTSALVCGRFITRLRATRSPMDALLVTTLVFLVLPFPKGDFGQREHLAVLGTLPYVLLAARRAVNGSVSTLEAVLTGIVGALGFALKPHFLLAWIAVEGGLAFQARQLGTLRHWQPLAAVGTLVAYTLVVVVGFPEYLEVADRVRRVYGGTNSPAVRLLEMRELQLGALALAILALVRLPPRHLSAQLVVGTAAGGFLLASLVQMKGWGYTCFPQVFLGLFFALALSNLFAAAPSIAQLVRGGARGAAVAAALCLTGMSAKYVERGRTRGAQRHGNPALTISAGTCLGRRHCRARHADLHLSGVPVGQPNGRGVVPSPQWPVVSARFLRAGTPGPTSDVPFHTPAAMSHWSANSSTRSSRPVHTAPGVADHRSASAYAPAGRRALDLVAYYGQDARFVRLLPAITRSTVPPFLVFKSRAGASCEKGDSARRDRVREEDAHE